MGETHPKMACFCQFAEFYRLRNKYSGITLKNQLSEKYKILKAQKTEAAP